MTVEDLIIYGKSKVTSQHAKMLLADLLNLNSLELLNCLSEQVSPKVEEEYKNKIEKLSKNYPIHCGAATTASFHFGTGRAPSLPAALGTVGFEPKTNEAISGDDVEE